MIYLERGSDLQLIMNQELNSDSKPQTIEQLPSSSHNDDEESEVDEAEVQKALKIMEKLKKIQKKGKLCQFKMKAKANNRLFHQMSLFFHKQQKRRETQKQLMYRRAKEARQARLNSRVNSTQRPKQISLPELQPEIQQKQQFSSILAIKCHICNQDYHQIHFFYGYLCPTCAIFNWKKRSQSANMTGLTALVTGARIKIGYEITLKLLRDGATVYATSRFPNDCLIRYKQQKDFDTWKQNLFIIQCDFLSQTQVSSLVNYIQKNVAKLDILINNAAQTIVRPMEFYAKQLKNQELCLTFPNKIPCDALSSLRNDQAIAFPSVYSSTVAKAGEIDLEHSDEFGQPLDKRTQNSWVQKIEEVSLMDCYTTQVINSIVPFYLISQLKSKMIGATPSWIINVSSMEGVFNRKSKQFYHPHTNMAKAALNMITRTSALQFKQHSIFMNSVDTGWVTNENPYHVAQEMIEKHKFKCPLDCTDGAMRVLDPIYLGLLQQKYPFGLFIKNYQPSSW